MGAVGFMLGGIELLALVVLVAGAGALIAYQKSREQDPGLTTEFALVLNCMLGAMAMRDGVLAARCGGCAGPAASRHAAGRHIAFATHGIEPSGSYTNFYCLQPSH